MRKLLLLSLFLCTLVSCGKHKIELPKSVQKKIDEAFVPSILCNDCIDTMEIKLDTGNLVIIKNKDITKFKIEK